MRARSVEQLANAWGMLVQVQDDLHWHTASIVAEGRIVREQSRALCIDARSIRTQCQATRRRRRQGSARRRASG